MSTNEAGWELATDEERREHDKWLAARSKYVSALRECTYIVYQHGQVYIHKRFATQAEAEQALMYRFRALKVGMDELTTKHGFEIKAHSQRELEARLGEIQAQIDALIEQKRAISALINLDTKYSVPEPQPAGTCYRY